MNTWELPQSVTINGTEFRFNADFRVLRAVNGVLSNCMMPEYVRWLIALGVFYEEPIPEACQEQAVKFLSDFISYGTPPGKPGPRLIDWDQDAQLIIGDVNKVAGNDIRAEQFVHWWTFLSYFYGVGEGQLSTVVSIRAKKAKGKTLEKWEQDYYRENRQRIDFQKARAPEDKEMQEYFNKWL